MRIVETIQWNENFSPFKFYFFFFYVIDRFLFIEEFVYNLYLIFFDRYVSREFSNFCRPIIRGGDF